MFIKYDYLKVNEALDITNYKETNSYSNFPIYIQQDATLHRLLYLETALHVLGGISTHHQKWMQLYLQNLVFVTPLLLAAAIVEELELFHDSGR